MQKDAQSLDEVVVTALGISRDKKSLGYATQEIKGDDIANSKSGNFVNALSGKASGVQINNNNNIIGMFKQWWQTNVDIQQQKDIYFATGRNVSWNLGSPKAGSPPIFWDNPY